MDQNKHLFVLDLVIFVRQNGINGEEQAIQKSEGGRGDEHADEVEVGREEGVFGHVVLVGEQDDACHGEQDGSRNRKDHRCSEWLPVFEDVAQEKHAIYDGVAYESSVDQAHMV